MRQIVIALVLLVVVSSLAAGTLTVEKRSVPLGQANPDVRMALERRESTFPCDEATRLELIRAGLGPVPPPGYVAPPYEPSDSRCDLICSPCSYFEGEPWCADDQIDVWNGGCNSIPAVFEVIEQSYGVIDVCATSGTFMFGALTYRDTDWYEFEVTEQLIVTLTCIGEFPLNMFIVDGTPGCIYYEMLEYISVPECEVGVMQHTLSPGTYWFVVVPQFFTGIPCGSEYTLTIDGFYAAPDCAAPCPGGAVVEEEPLCGIDYEDHFNGGCNSVPAEFGDVDPGQYIVLCGETGVYEYYGSCWRDTDWYELVLDEPRDIDFCIMAGFDYQLLIVDEVDGCNEFYIVETLTGPPCDVACDTYSLGPGTYWLWVGSWSWVPVDCGRSYVVTISGYTTPVEEATWGSVKALYR